MRICIIGSGLYGLSVLRQFSVDKRYELTAYEQGSTLGGLWNYPEGCEIYTKGVSDTSPYYSRMYRDLRINTSKALTHFADFPFPSYVDDHPRLAEVSRYFRDYANLYNLRQYVKFRHQVVQVDRLQDGAPTFPKWLVTVENVATYVASKFIFDVVIVCQGRHRFPYTGTIPGLENFTGDVIHSSLYRVPEPYRNLTVLVLGAGFSGIDVVCGLLPQAKKIFLSHKTARKVLYDKYSNVVETGAVRNFTENSVVFEDSTATPIDAVILCTGYQIHIPFITASCGLTTSRGRVSPLYRHVINCRYQSMAFLGLVMGPAGILPANMAKYYKAFLDRQMSLPPVERMIQETDAEYDAMIKSGVPEHHAHVLKEKVWGLMDKMGRDAGFTPYSAADREVSDQHRKQLVMMPCISERMAVIRQHQVAETELLPKHELSDQLNVFARTVL